MTSTSKTPRDVAMKLNKHIGPCIEETIASCVYTLESIGPALETCDHEGGFPGICFVLLDNIAAALSYEIES